VDSSEQFGLVGSNNATTFGGLFLIEVKNELKSEDSLLSLDPSEDLNQNLEDERLRVVDELGIDPQLLNLPLVQPTANTSAHEGPTSAPTEQTVSTKFYNSTPRWNCLTCSQDLQHADMPNITPSSGMGNSALKRKAIEPPIDLTHEDEPVPPSKKPWPDIEVSLQRA
jgi:hypothetical protein